MNKYTECELWEAIKARCEGKTVECYRKDGSAWFTLGRHSNVSISDTDHFTFRIVEEIKMRPKFPVSPNRSHLSVDYSVDNAKHELASVMLANGLADVDDDGTCTIVFTVSCEPVPD